MEILETNLVAHSDCLDLLRNTQFGLPSTQTDSSSRLLRVPKFVPEDVADIVTASLHRVKYARGLLVYLNVFWSTGTCYRLCVCCACISATAPRLADSGRTRRSRQRPRPRQRLHGTTTTTKGLIVYTKQTSRVGFNTYT